MPALFTTEVAPTHRRLALWQDIVCDVFVQLDCKSDLGTAFHGAITSAPLGAAKCSEVSSGQQRVFRTPSRISRANEDFILIALGRRGEGAVLQDGRETIIRPGEFAIYDTTRPYELQFNDDFTQTIFQIPREKLHRRFAGTHGLTAVTFTPDRPVDRLAYQFIASVSEVADRLDLDTALRLSDQAIDLVAMAMSERLGRARCRHRPIARRCCTASRRTSWRTCPTPICACRKPRQRSAFRRVTSTACLPTNRPRSSVMYWRSGWSIAGVTCHLRHMRSVTSGKSHSPGVLATCRISAGCSANILACRHATGGRANCPIDRAAESFCTAKNREIRAVPAAIDLR